MPSVSGGTIISSEITCGRNSAGTVTSKCRMYNFGIEVRTLVNKDQSAGSYEVKFDANRLSGREYFYKVQAGEFVQSKKMLLTK